MYLHPDHRFTDPEAALALLAAHPLGSWVCAGADGLVANHLPFFLDRGRGPRGTLVGHVSRANPVWRQLDADGSTSVVVFQGPQAYVSPGWYPGKARDGRVVPTWDYAVVHAHGRARAVHDRAWLRAMLDRLTDAHEAGRPAPWHVADAPADYLDALLGGIVGIELPIDRLESRLKASQDEARDDRVGTVQGLRRQPGDAARQMAALVKQALDAEAATGTPAAPPPAGGPGTA